jgi:hypothetical protein
MVSSKPAGIDRILIVPYFAFFGFAETLECEQRRTSGTASKIRARENFLVALLCKASICYSSPFVDSSSSRFVEYRRRKPVPNARRPVPNNRRDAGSGTSEGGDEGGGVGVGVGVGVVVFSSQSSQPLIKTNGIAARNKKGHFGNAPPGMIISPQSQTLPSTTASSISSTDMVGVSDETITPDRRVSPLVLPSGPPLLLEPEGNLGSWALEGALVSERFFSRRSTELCVGFSVWTTWFITIGPA